MIDSLINSIRRWHFEHTCRRHPERIGLEFRRALAAAQGRGTRVHAIDPKPSDPVGTLRIALGAAAASRWNIRNKAEIARIFESLTDEQKGRLFSAVSMSMLRRWG